MSSSKLYLLSDLITLPALELFVALLWFPEIPEYQQLLRQKLLK